MMFCSERKSARQQRGAIALGTALILLLLMTWIVMAALQVAAGDQRSLNNELRRQSTAALAEGGLARGLGYLSRHSQQVRSAASAGWLDSGGSHWTPCSSSDRTLPCGDGLQNRYGAAWSGYRNLVAAAWSNDAGTAQVHALARSADLLVGAATPMVISIVSEGRSADQIAHVTVYQDVLIYPMLAAIPEAPVMAGAVQLAGEGSLVSNIDGAGSGLALSVWAAADAQLLDSVRSCVPSVAMTQGCTAAFSSSAVSEGADVLDVDGDQGVLRDSQVSPGDLLLRLFGVATPDWRRLRSQARPLNCAQLTDLLTAGLWWSDGDCVLPAGAVLGSVTAPIALIVVNGDWSAIGGSIHGLVLMLSTDGVAHSARLQNQVQISGALLASGGLRIEGTGFQIRYDAAVLNALMRGAVAPLGIAVVPGSWRDHS